MVASEHIIIQTENAGLGGCLNKNVRLFCLFYPFIQTFKPTQWYTICVILCISILSTCTYIYMRVKAFMCILLRRCKTVLPTHITVRIYEMMLTNSRSYSIFGLSTQKTCPYYASQSCSIF